MPRTSRDCILIKDSTNANGLLKNSNETTWDGIYACNDKFTGTRKIIQSLNKDLCISGAS